jgi:hypothetical protein
MIYSSEQWQQTLQPQYTHHLYDLLIYHCLHLYGTISFLRDSEMGNAQLLLNQNIHYQIYNCLSQVPIMSCKSRP